MRDILNLIEAAQAEIDEAAPTAEISAGRFYHGTDNTAKAQSIMQNGLRGLEIQGKGKLAPVKGRAYLTPSIRYAAIYAIGGDFLGYDMKGEYRPRTGEQPDRYGYVMVVPGSVIQDVIPDEDSVGEFVGKYTKRNHYGSYKYTAADFECPKDDPEYAMKRMVWLNLLSAMTPRQFHGSQQGLIAQQAAGGKRALKSLSEESKLLLLKWGAHLAVTGDIRPTEVWRIDKNRSKDIAKDGSNFFEIAERIK